ncbi:hypothetical protein OJAV_G00121000 [Oryzias javanicus]|uniref:Family with sequence similarity 78 member Ab n=1 Tax=Oryzias javanicus TaxID=123683 RepID=A0A437CT07_ORYJA|nr:hypothetical protein OJAV_G00121000 [Oryzias javanicus]
MGRCPPLLARAKNNGITSISARPVAAAAASISLETTHLIIIDLWTLLWIGLQFSAMGCIQSIRCKPKSFRESIIVLELNASIDSNPTSIDEASGVVLRYRTPHFRATARVLVPPVPAKETWTIGWIQACNHMEFFNTYGDKGMSSWELPDLRDGKIQAISDSDGVNYPWYGNTTETCIVVGPTKKDSKFTLSSIHRDQSFTTWLVAINQATSETLVLQTIRWRMRLHIHVDPEKPLGLRAVLKEPVAQEQPQILGKNEPIPPNAMVKPNANDAQVLMWRPKSGDPVVVIPPKY